jgi:8-oxo-dGTP pyrophosphatase MutT (NUDIX family)
VTTPRPASTVILVREAAEGLEVYLLKRSPQSQFMPGNFVFPGGTVETGDNDPDFWSHRVDVGVETLFPSSARIVDCENGLAHAVAAIRETFEEAGVFIGLADSETPDGLQRAGKAQGAPSRCRFRDWVLAEDRVLAVSRLHPWSHWITPSVQPKRFDTRFFLAFLSQGARCLPDREETTQGAWMSAREALEENERGAAPLSPPTLVTLHELLPYNDRRSLEEALRTRHWGAPRIPRLQRLQASAVLLLPWDPDYGLDGSPPADPQGVAFSRLRFDGKLWHPVAKGLPRGRTRGTTG